MDPEANKTSQENAAAATSQTRRRWPIIIAAIALISLAGIGAWLLWPKQAGRAVPAPRSVSFAESPQPPTAGEPNLTLTPHQMPTAQCKIEPAGERAVSEAAGRVAT